MREILFRGKSVKSGSWVYGYYLKDEDGGSLIVNTVVPSPCGYCIEEFDSIKNYSVNPETVGQYIWKLDWEGNKLFEGDIVRLHNRFSCEEEGFAVVISEDCIEKNGFGRWFPQDTRFFELAGNIYDNPELLKEEGNG